MMKFRHREINGKLLNIPFDASLRFKLNDDTSSTENVGVQLRLTGAISAHCIDVHTGLDHVRCEDGCVRLVRGNRRDYVCTFDGLTCRPHGDNLQSVNMLEVLDEPGRCGLINVERPD